MEERKGAQVMLAALTVMLCLSIGASGVFRLREANVRREMAMQQQREMADVIAAMADIEVNLSKLLIASGARQSVSLLGETALLAQHVESGLSRMAVSEQTAGDAMKFAGQMGQYSLALAAQVSDGGMLTGDDERQIEDMMQACHALGQQLAGQGGEISWPDAETDSGIEYPSLIYDGPFSDGRTDRWSVLLNTSRFSRQQAREAAAKYAGVTVEHVTEAADSGGRFEAFGFTADTPDGHIAVQVTGQGGFLLWMMPENAEFAQRRGEEECLQNAKVYLADVGFGEMEPCFVQQYDGMVVANFAAVQDGVTLYSDQVKVQVSMDSGRVVGAECSQYLANHTRRTDIVPTVDVLQAREMVSGRLSVKSERLCVIPQDKDETLCWGFECTDGAADYWVFVNAKTREIEQILRVITTNQGEAAL